MAAGDSDMLGVDFGPGLQYLEVYRGVIETGGTVSEWADIRGRRIVGVVADIVFGGSTSLVDIDPWESELVITGASASDFNIIALDDVIAADAEPMGRMTFDASGRFIYPWAQIANFAVPSLDYHKRVRCTMTASGLNTASSIVGLLSMPAIAP